MADAWIDKTLPPVISTITTNRSNKSQFSALTNNADRVQFCLAQKEVQCWVGEFVSKFASNQNDSKCPNTAAKYREKGNDRFRGHNFKSAIELYSNAICFAPQSGEDTASELALAFGNRSAAYFQLGEHDNALKDINDALALGYGQFKSATKLQLRKCDCLIKLGRASEAQKLLLLVQQPTDDENDINRWIELFGRVNLDDEKNKVESISEEGKVCFIDKLTQNGLFESNEKMSSFSAKVAVHYNSVKGRHLVAKENIQFGDIIALSRPYATLLASNALKCCEHCCRVIFEDGLVSSTIRPVPCTTCSNVVYCSEECHTESANSYHRYECGQHHLMVELPKFSRMSLRLLYQADLGQIRSVAASSADDDNSSHLSEQADDHYSHLYQLVHHSDGPLKDMNINLYENILKWSILSCLLLQLVKNNSNFPMKPKEDKKLIGDILLRHHLQLYFNTFCYSPFNKKESPSSPVLLELYPMYASTLNHSCMASARLESPNNDERVCLLQAARQICAGTEITIPYLNTKDPNSIPRLPELFKGRYQFTCFCARCEYFSRITPFGVAGGHLMLSCSDCSDVMEIASKERSESEVFRCTNCRFTMTNAEVIRRYNTIAKLEHTFFQIQRTDEKPIPKLLPIIGQIEALLNRDSAAIGYLYCMIGMSYVRNGEMDKYWSCYEHYLSIFEAIYGKESVELMAGFTILQNAFARVEKDNPMMMRAFERQDRELYQRYLARVEQWKQLKRKYYRDY